MRKGLLSWFILSLVLSALGCHSGGTPQHHDRPPQKTSVHIQQPS